MFIFTAGPHTALVKSSGARRADSQIVIGGRLLAIPILERVDKLDLRLRTLTVHTPKGTTINGVRVDIVSCCQVKIKGWTLDQATGKMTIDSSAVRLAAQHFIGKKNHEIEETLQGTVAGHQRAIIGVLTVEQLYKDRIAFSKRVLELCQNDLREMGFSVVSYTVSEITDEEGYMEALGVTQTEKVKRSAMEGAALHLNEAKSRKGEEETKAEIQINLQRERIIQSEKELQMKKADAEREVSKVVAVQQKAASIASAEQDGILKVSEQDANAKETAAKRLVMEQKVKMERFDKLISVTVPADADLYKKRVEADIVRENANAQADRIRQLGQAEAQATRMKGRADIAVLQERVKIWTNSASQGTIMEKLINVLPEIAAEIAKPLEKTEKLVFIGNGEDEKSTPLHSNAVKNAQDMYAEDAAKGMSMDRIMSLLALGSASDLSGVQSSVTKATGSKLGKAVVP